MAMTNADNAGAMNWLKDAYRLIHMDAHLAEFKEIYTSFDAAGAARELKKIG